MSRRTAARMKRNTRWMTRAVTPKIMTPPGNASMTASTIQDTATVWGTPETTTPTRGAAMAIGIRTGGGAGHHIRTTILPGGRFRSMGPPTTATGTAATVTSGDPLGGMVPPEHLVPRGHRAMSGPRAATIRFTSGADLLLHCRQPVHTNPPLADRQVPPQAPQIVELARAHRVALTDRAMLQQGQVRREHRPGPAAVAGKAAVTLQPAVRQHHQEDAAAATLRLPLLRRHLRLLHQRPAAAEVALRPIRESAVVVTDVDSEERKL